MCCKNFLHKHKQMLNHPREEEMTDQNTSSPKPNLRLR